MNCRCPIVQIASIDCSKDSFEPLSNAVMPRIKEQMTQLNNSSAFVVHSAKNPKQHRKAFLFPNILGPSSFDISNNLLSYDMQGRTITIDLSLCFDVTEEDFSYRDLHIKVIISNFHDLHIGDLAFLAMAIGMNNSSGAHCILCKKKARQFDCALIPPQDVRTKASLTECLNECNRNRLTNCLLYTSPSPRD